MAKTPAQPPKPNKPSKPENSPAPAVPVEPTRAKSETDRLTIPLDKDGRPDFASMRDKTRERVRKLVSDPSVARELGIAPDAAPSVATLPPFVTGAVLTGINQLEILFIARMTKAPASVIVPIAVYTPEERAAIEPALDNVLNKYGGSLIGKWGDELALAVLLSSITMRKIEAVRAAMPRQAPAPVIVHPSSPATPAPGPDEPPAGDVNPDVFQ